MNRIALRVASALFVSGVICLSFGSAATAGPWKPSANAEQISLWPSSEPKAGLAGEPEDDLVQRENPTGGKPWHEVANVVHPAMVIYPPKALNTGVAVMVVPGGGYQYLAIDMEGSEACDWLMTKGITCILLKYRVPNSGPTLDPKCNCRQSEKPWAALQDAQRAMGLIRKNAAKWKIDPNKVGVLGFSAGGHLVAAISTQFEKRSYKPIDGADKESCRPSFAVVIYPGMLSMEEASLKLNPDIQVPADAPPTFLLQAEDDHVNRVEDSMAYFAALKKSGIPTEMHIYAKGNHSFGLRPTNLPITKWPRLVEVWLGTLGMIATK